MEDKNIVLNCGGKKCCPVLNITEDKGITIKDDDGKTVKLNNEQVQKLYSAIKDIV